MLAPTCLMTSSQCSGNFYILFNCLLEWSCLLCQVTAAFSVFEDWTHWPHSGSFSFGKSWKSGLQAGRGITSRLYSVKILFIVSAIWSLVLSWSGQWPLFFLTPRLRRGERMILVFWISSHVITCHTFVSLQNGSNNGHQCIVCRSSQPTRGFLVFSMGLALTKPLGPMWNCAVI